MSTSFFAEALRIWGCWEGPDSYATLSAIELLSLTAMFTGKGAKSLELHEQAISMGARMKLLVSGERDQAHRTASDTRAASHSAWGLFAYST